MMYGLSEDMRQFSEYVKTLGNYDYLAAGIACRTAPTLCNIKPSSLISLTNNGRNVPALWEEYKYELSFNLKLNFFELRRSPERVLVLFYRAEQLSLCLAKEENKEFLKKIGYADDMNLQQKLNLLQKRFAQKEKCPHEIGVFLGFPVQDVAAFIRYKGAGCLLCGYWKVYHNPEQARLVFRYYDLAKTAVIRHIAGLSGRV
jgi:hypothetical protein